MPDIRWGIYCYISVERIAPKSKSGLLPSTPLSISSSSYDKIHCLDGSLYLDGDLATVVATGTTHGVEYVPLATVATLS